MMNVSHAKCTAWIRKKNERTKKKKNKTGTATWWGWQTINGVLAKAKKRRTHNWKCDCRTLLFSYARRSEINLNRPFIWVSVFFRFCCCCCCFSVTLYGIMITYHHTTHNVFYLLIHWTELGVIYCFGCFITDDGKVTDGRPPHHTTICQTSATATWPPY